MNKLKSFCILALTTLLLSLLPLIAIAAFTRDYLETSHVKITVENDTPGALKPYETNIQTALEYGWKRYQVYTGGYDLNQLLNAAPTTPGLEKPKYVFEFLNPSNMW